ncbi:MAG: MATE family efflux transporter [Candidatus Omnitrophica bacterium]|nr:MATE family efflux transporter [Candidatus Omnitrophota bacterium]
MDRSYQIGEKSIPHLLLKFSMPSILSLVLHALYGIVDRIFIGRGVGSSGLAGVTIAFPVLLIVFSLCVLFSSGSSALISIYLGEKNKERAEYVLGSTFVVITITGLLVSFLGVIFHGRILGLFDISPDTYSYASDYLRIFLSGSIFFFYGFALTFIIRAEGNPVYATLMIVAGTLLNIPLDYFFIFVISMGTSGAALATVISEAVVALMGIFYIMRKRGVLHITRRHLAVNLSEVKKMVGLGLSPAFDNIAASLQVGLLNSRIVFYGGEIAVAAMGIVFAIGSIVRMFSFGMAAGMQPIVGYNYGANLSKRVKQAMLYASSSGFLITLLMVVSIWIFAEHITGLFCSADKELVKLSSYVLRVYLFMSPFATVHLLGVRFFQSTGKAFYAVLMGLFRQVIIFIPALYSLSYLFKLEGIWFSGPVTDILAFTVTVALIVRELKKAKYAEHSRV